MSLPRWAIVGLGKQAVKMAEAARDVGHIVVAIVGQENHAAAFSSYAAQRFDTLAEAIEGARFDAVCITSPNYLHARQAIEAFRAKKHVLLEKPMALSAKESRAIMRAARSRGMLGAINFHLRQHSAVQRARDLLLSNDFGTIVSADLRWSIGNSAGMLSALPRDMQWREDPALSGGGALMARGVHLFDLLRFITASEVVEVSAISDANKTTIDRTAIGLLRMENGAAATMVTSKQMLGARNGIEISCTKGALSLDIFDSPTGVLRVNDANGSREETYLSSNLYAAVFNSFTLQLAGDTRAGATFEDGIASVEITEAFQKSVRTRKTVAL